MKKNRQGVIASDLKKKPIGQIRSVANQEIPGFPVAVCKNYAYFNCHNAIYYQTYFLQMIILRICGTQYWSFDLCNKYW